MAVCIPSFVFVVAVSFSLFTFFPLSGTGVRGANAVEAGFCVVFFFLIGTGTPTFSDGLCCDKRKDRRTKPIDAVHSSSFAERPGGFGDFGDCWERRVERRTTWDMVGGCGEFIGLRM